MHSAVSPVNRVETATIACALYSTTCAAVVYVQVKKIMKYNTCPYQMKVGNLMLFFSVKLIHLKFVLCFLVCDHTLEKSNVGRLLENAQRNLLILCKLLILGL